MPKKGQLPLPMSLSGRCYILAGGIRSRAPQDSYPVSRNGWYAAREAAYVAQRQDGAGYATLVCPDGGLPLYQCYRGEPCTIESGGGSAGVDRSDWANKVLAGRTPTKRKRRTAKNTLAPVKIGDRVLSETGMPGTVLGLRFGRLGEGFHDLWIARVQWHGKHPSISHWYVAKRLKVSP